MNKFPICGKFFDASYSGAKVVQIFGFSINKCLVFAMKASKSVSSGRCRWRWGGLPTMLKKKIDYDKAAKMLFSRTEHYADNVRRLYATATDELLKLSAMKASNGVSAAFSFSDSKRLSEQANAILRALYSGVYNEIKGGVIAEWGNANKSCDALITSIFGKKVKEDNHYARFFARNKESVDAFFKRKSEYGGLNLSQRVWKYVGDFKTEMEMALSVAMGEGKSAATISREVRKYLQRPDMMFRRFRVKTGEQDIFDADGNVVGKEPVYWRVWKRKVVDAVTGNVSWQTVNLKDYSFGRGVYRSSYKNAMRLARTETNMAYRTADQERWRQLDFVIGYRVVLSDNHPEPDICNDLSAKRGEKGSRGVYPKDFVFKGWHPQCRCYVVPILADEKEFDKIQEAILNDEPIPESKSVIREPNKYFQDWWKSNKSRVAEAQSLPYWVKDNPKYTRIKREKTDIEKQNIQKRWNERKEKNEEGLLLKEYKTNEQIEKTFAKINKTFSDTESKWFENGDLKLDVETNPRNNGSTQMNGEILLKQDRIDKVKSALSKIGKGKWQDITDDEADAMATFWHEITHNRNKQGNMALTTIQRRYMELANEFVARKTLPEFYQKLGCSETPQPQFMTNRNSTGYNRMVNNYDFVIQRLGLDADKTLAAVRESLYNKAYTKQQTGLKKGLVDGGIKHADGSKAKNSELYGILQRCKDSSQTTVENYLKENKFIVEEKK